MAATKDGDDLSEFFRFYTESFISNASLIFALLAKRYMNVVDQRNNNEWIERSWVVKQQLESNMNNNFSKFYETFKYVETGVLTTPVVQAPPVQKREFVENMMIHGPVQAQKTAIQRGVPVNKLTDEDLDEIFRGVGSLQAEKTVEQARDTQIKKIESDSSTSQFVRVPNSGACKFCLMLAARGPVYTKQTSKFQSHRKCKCHPEAVFKGYSASKYQQDAAQDWLDENSYDIKKAKDKSNQEKVAAGLLKAKTEDYRDENTGVLRSRTTYVKTQKAKLADEAERIKNSKAVKKSQYTPDKPQNASEFNKNASKKDILSNLTAFKYALKPQIPDSKLGGIANNKKWAKENGIFDNIPYDYFTKKLV